MSFDIAGAPIVDPQEPVASRSVSVEAGGRVVDVGATVVVDVVVDVDVELVEVVLVVEGVGRVGGGLLLSEQVVGLPSQ